MVGPLDDELKRTRRIKQYQDYSSQLDKVEKEALPEAKGDLQGKKVTKMPENSVAKNLFKRLH